MTDTNAIPQEFLLTDTNVILQEKNTGKILVDVDLLNKIIEAFKGHIYSTPEEMLIREFKLCIAEDNPNFCPKSHLAQSEEDVLRAKLSRFFKQNPRVFGFQYEDKRYPIVLPYRQEMGHYAGPYNPIKFFDFSESITDGCAEEQKRRESVSGFKSCLAIKVVLPGGNEGYFRADLFLSDKTVYF